MMIRNLIIVFGSAFAAIVIGVLIFLYSGLSISNTSASAVNEYHPTAVAVPFMEIAHGTQSNVLARTNYLVTSVEELNKLWGIIDADGKVPSIDFSRNYVAAVFAGSQSTTGFTIEVSKVEDTSIRNVTVTITEPGKDCSKKKSATAPYAVIELPKTSLHLAHEDQTTITDCSQ